MQILIEKECFYVSSKGTNSTDDLRKQLKQRRRCLLPPPGQLQFPSDTSLEKMLYLASQNITKKWTQRYRNWDQVLNQLIVLYGERLTEYL